MTFPFSLIFYLRFFYFIFSFLHILIIYVLSLYFLHILTIYVLSLYILHNLIIFVLSLKVSKPHSIPQNHSDYKSTHSFAIKPSGILKCSSCCIMDNIYDNTFHPEIFDILPFLVLKFFD